MFDWMDAFARWAIPANAMIAGILLRQILDLIANMIFPIDPYHCTERAFALLAKALKSTAFVCSCKLHHF